MLRQASKIRPSVQSAYSVVRSASVSTQVERPIVSDPVMLKGNSTEPVRYDWVNDPTSNPRLMTFDGLGSGLDLDQPDYPYDARRERVGAGVHAQPQEELLAADEGL